MASRSLPTDGINFTFHESVGYELDNEDGDGSVSGFKIPRGALTDQDRGQGRKRRLVTVAPPIGSRPLPWVRQGPSALGCPARGLRKGSIPDVIPPIPAMC